MTFSFQLEKKIGNAALEMTSPQHTLRCMAWPSFLCLILIVKVHVRDAMYDVLTRALTRTLDDQTSNLKKMMILRHT